MPLINITVKNKIATGDGSVIICGNSDYTVNFSFDSEWAEFTSRTMRVQFYDGTYNDVLFTGNSCPLPVIVNKNGLQIGVYAGNLHTTVGAVFDTEKSILCEGGTPAAPAPSVYQQLLESLDGKIDEPETEGTNGQVLTTDGNGGRNWCDVEQYTGGTGIKITNEKSIDLDISKLPQSNVVRQYSYFPVQDNNIDTKKVSIQGLGDALNQYGGLFKMPLTGIPKTDLASGVQESLNKADNANAVIPAQASAQNQLADKAFVNSSVATNTAYFRGTFNSVAELEAYAGEKTNNDYAFVIGTDSAGNTIYNRYKWNGTSWVFEYALNNSSFTAVQWAAISSAITAAKVQNYDAHIASQNNPHNVTKEQIGAQATLVSGQNIKTVGGNSILGSGDISVGGGEAQFELIEKIIVGYSITTQQPADWETNYTDYFTNTGTLREPVYTSVTGESAPTWESGMYYSFTSPITDFIRNTEADGTPYAFSKIFLYSPNLKGTTNSSYGRLIVNSNSKYDYRNQLFSESFQGLFTNTEREVAITLTLKGNDLSKGILGECIVAIGRKIDTSKSVYKFTSRVWNQNSIIKRLQFGGTEQTVDGNTEISIFGVRA